MLVPTLRITDLRPDKRIPGNLVIELNGARFATLPAEVVTPLGIEVDLELGPDQYERLSRIAEVESAYRVAIRLLAARPRGVNELLRKLRERGHNTSAAAEAVGSLESKGILDDSAFACHFARVRLSRAHGPSRILTDLLAKGVDRRLAERAIDTAIDQEAIDIQVAARTLAEKRVGQLGSLPPQKMKQRLLGYLARRGYRGYHVREMVDEVVEGAGSGE
jgi:regulatory protein